MFTNDELFPIYEKHNGPTYNHIISEVIKNGEKHVDLSIFTYDEVRQIKIFLAELSGASYLLERESENMVKMKYYNENNPDKQKNIEQRDKIIQTKNELAEIHNIKESPLFIEDKFYTIYDYQELYEKLIFKYEKKNVTKDKLRKWFIEKIEIKKLPF